MVSSPRALSLSHTHTHTRFLSLSLSLFSFLPGPVRGSSTCESNFLRVRLAQKKEREGERERDTESRKKVKISSVYVGSVFPTRPFPLFASIMRTTGSGETKPIVTRFRWADWYNNENGMWSWNWMKRRAIRDDELHFDLDCGSFIRFNLNGCSIRCW